MGWSIRKSLRLLPGVRVNISKNGPRLSVGFPGARASIGIDGKASIYGGKGPLRYRKTITMNHVPGLRDHVSAMLKRVFGIG
jgi:hypothetical protein